MIPELSIVVCTYQRADLILHSLDALAAQTLDPSRWELIVVDNNSPDDTRDVVEDFQKNHPDLTVRYVLETRQGLSHARNCGFSEAKAPFVAFVDDDARAERDWAERILEIFGSVYPEPFCVGGKYLPWYQSLPPAWFTDEFETRTWGEREGYLTGKRGRFGLSGSNMAYPKAVLKDYGGFPTDPALMQRNLGEETHLNYRIFQTHPERCDRLFYYDPKLIVYHYTTPRNWEVGYRLQRSRKAGVSIAFVEGAKPSNRLFWKMLAYGGKVLVLFPFRVLFGSGLFKTRWLRAAQELWYVRGYLAGSFSQ